VLVAVASSRATTWATYVAVVSSRGTSWAVIFVGGTRVANPTLHVNDTTSILTVTPVAPSVLTVDETSSELILTGA
jgi:hypothetical protein